uniref:F-box domain-containing protein n=1 Tax=Strongyloides venezuelensis TaxID=75913 RepID=A0A0K0G3P1_STRVS
MLLSLPDKALIQIFCNLSYEDLNSVKEINERFKKIIEENYKLMATVEVLTITIANIRTEKTASREIGIYIIHGSNENCFFVKFDKDLSGGSINLSKALISCKSDFTEIKLGKYLELFDLFQAWCKYGVHPKKIISRKFPRRDLKDFLSIKRDIGLLDKINIHFIRTYEPIYDLTSVLSGRSHNQFSKNHFQFYLAGQ